MARQKYSRPSPIPFLAGIVLIGEVVKDVADRLKLCLF